MENGDYVTFLLPAEIDIDLVGGGSTASVPIPIRDENGDDTGEVLAYVIFTEGSKEVRIEFTSAVDDYDEIDFAYFEFDGKFNAASLGGGGDKEIEFEICGQSFKINVSFKTVELDVAKTLKDATQSSDGTYHQTWKLVANREKMNLKNLELKDTLPDGLAFEGFQFEGAAENALPDGWSADTSGNPITFSYAGSYSDTVTLYIKTKVVDLSSFGFQNDKFIIENKVEFSADDAGGSNLGSVTDTATSTITMKWIEKNGNFVLADEAIDWTIKIPDIGQTINEAVLTDTLPKGVEMDETSIVIYKGANREDEFTAGTAGSGADYIYEVETDTNGNKVYKFFLGDIDDVFTITYSTNMTEAVTNDDVTFRNSAYLTWKWNGNDYQSGNFNVGVSVSNYQLRKRSVWYYPKRKYIEWDIAVNQMRMPIKGTSTLTDTFNNHGQNQVYREGTLKITASPAYNGRSVLSEQDGDFTFEMNAQTGTFTIEFPDGLLDGRMLVVYFEMDIDDLDFLAQNGSNSGRTYYNTATLEIEGEDPIDHTASQYITTRVLEKKLNGYDSATRSFEWELSVNPHQLEGLGKTTITDKLPDGTSLYDFEVYEGVLVEKNHTATSDEDIIERGRKLDMSELNYVYDEVNHVLTVTFNETQIEGTAYIIVVRTQLDDEFFEKNHDSTQFINEATIEMENVKHTIPPVTATGNASSSIVEKDGSFEEDEGIITWEVMVNQNGMDWDLTGASVTDDLQDGLVLDIESVKLEKYSVDANGQSQFEEEVSFSKNDCIRYDIDTNLFTFTFPEIESGFAYKLVFDTDVMESNTYVNEVVFEGVRTIHEGSNATITANLNSSAAGAMANRKASITLTKTDGDTGLPLEGITFTLENEKGEVIETKTTDSTGTIAFKSLLSHQTPYYLREVSTKEGYALLKDPIPVFIEKGENGRTADPATLTYTAKNYLIHRDVEIEKVDEEGNPLSGVEFTLLNKEMEPMEMEGLSNPVVTDKDGKASFKNIPYGTYYLVETNAPEHVVMDDTPILVEVHSEGEDALVFRITNEVIPEPEPTPSPSEEPTPSPSEEPSPSEPETPSETPTDATGDGTPKTGDGEYMAIWVFVLIVLMIIAIALLITRR